MCLIAENTKINNNIYYIRIIMKYLLVLFTKNLYYIVTLVIRIF